MPGLNQAIPPPDPRDLLPPLLACLSTASTAKDAPPGLLPLLSPILRQRLQLLASGDWLSLLSWDREAGSRLPHVIDKIHVEPHPSSGEIEVEEPDHIWYRRSDPETLHARLELADFGLIPTYLWCTAGEHGNRWLLAELRAMEDSDDGTEWFAAMGEADEAGFRRRALKSNGISSLPALSQPEPAKDDDDDDGSYWAAYDTTPGGQTPMQKRSPAPMAGSRTQIGPTQSELDYFARYASEVQPALDAHDPDEEHPAAGESTLNGNTLGYTREPQKEPLATRNLGSNGYDSSFASAAAIGNATQHVDTIESSVFSVLNHPRPASSASENSVERLERQAGNYSQAEVAIKQHISTDIKSLFRLARASGIDREEFERIVQRELEVLPLLEQEMQ
ncbi:hypothetical protein ACEQ8H_005832 [Pleosporales sp. CAS-2024a]